MKPGSRRTVTLGVTLLGLTYASAANAGLGAAWDTSYRTSASPPQVVKVYLCISTFDTWFPSMDKTALRTALEHSLWQWNTYGAVDLSLRSYGDRVGTGGGCSANTLPGPGEITVRAEEKHPSLSWTYGYGTTDNDISGTGIITRASVILYAKELSGTPFVVSFHTDGVSLNETALMNHELGHTIGMAHVTSVPSVMDPNMGSGFSQVLWHDDVVSLRSGIGNHYTQVTDRQILHKVQYPAGSGSWAPEGNLGEYTNLRLGVANDHVTTSQRSYLIGWTGTDGANTINTVLGDGSYYDPSTKDIHWGVTSHYGPAAIYARLVGGQTRFLLVFVSPDDSRHLVYQWSETALPGTWSTPTEVTYNVGGSTAYASMAEPALAWSGAKHRFVLAWSNLAADATAGRIRICTTSDPAMHNFGNCVDTGQSADTSPAVACSSSSFLNECVVTWADTAENGYKLCQRKGKVNNSDAFTWTTGTSCNSAQSANSPPSLASIGGIGYALAYRGLDGSRSGNYWVEPTYNSWTGPSFITSEMLTPPSLAFGSQYNEFAYYYVNYSPP